MFLFELLLIFCFPVSPVCVSSFIILCQQTDQMILLFDLSLCLFHALPTVTELLRQIGISSVQTAAVQEIVLRHKSEGLCLFLQIVYFDPLGICLTAFCLLYINDFPNLFQFRKATDFLPGFLPFFFRITTVPLLFTVNKSVIFFPHLLFRGWFRNERFVFPDGCLNQGFCESIPKPPVGNRLLSSGWEVAPSSTAFLYLDLILVL